MRRLLKTGASNVAHATQVNLTMGGGAYNSGNQREQASTSGFVGCSCCHLVIGGRRFIGSARLEVVPLTTQQFRKVRERETECRRGFAVPVAVIRTCGLVPARLIYTL
jgi:hypothetical protein